MEQKTLSSLKKDCSDKLSDVELKCLLCYCEAHYVNKDVQKEIFLTMALDGRQIDMPSRYVFTNYKFK